MVIKNLYSVLLLLSFIFILKATEDNKTIMEINPFEDSYYEFIAQEDIQASKKLFNLSKKLWLRNLLLMEITEEQKNNLQLIADNDLIEDYEFADKIKARLQELLNILYFECSYEPNNYKGFFLNKNDSDFFYIGYIPSINCLVIHLSIHKMDVFGNKEKIELYRLAYVTHINYFVNLPNDDPKIELIKFIENSSYNIKKTNSCFFSYSDIAKAMGKTFDEVSTVMQSFDENAYQQFVSTYRIIKSNNGKKNKDCCIIA